MLERTLELPHPIVFVMDFDNESAEVPPYSPDSVTAANASCISVRAVADVDGEATIVLAKANESESVGRCREVFRGDISTPSGKVAIVTSENEKLMEIEVTGARSSVAIFVDEEENPTRIVVMVIPGFAANIRSTRNDYAPESDSD